jgi:hypothetical protein
MCFEQVTAQQQQQLEESSILDFKKRKKNNQDDSNKTNTMNTNMNMNTSAPPPPPAPPPGTSTGTGSSTTMLPTATAPSLLQDLETTTDSVLQSLSKKNKSAETSFLAKRRLLSQQQAMEQEEKEQTSLLLLQHQQHQQHTPEPVPSPSHQTTTTTGSRSGSTASTSAQPCDNQDKTAQAYRQLGLAAAAHLEQLGRALLASDAPLLWQEVSVSAASSDDAPLLQQQWVNKLMSLATRCCATVEPNVKKGDLLDIRPYCKIKGK